MPDSLLEAISAIYDAALDPGRWPLALQLTSKLLTATSATVGLRSTAGGPPARHSIGLSAPIIKEYDDRYSPVDPVLQFVVTAAPGVYTDAMIVPRSELSRSLLYNEYAKPNDIPFVMQALAFRDSSGTGLVTITHSRTQGGFEDDQVRTLSLLLPHFERAMRMQMRLRTVEVETQTRSLALDSLPEPIMVTDASGRVLFANRAAEKLFAHSDALRTYRGVLRASLVPETTALRRLIANASAGDAPQTGGSMLLDCPREPKPRSVLVMPLAQAVEASFLPTHRPAAIVIVSNPAAVRVAPLAVLQEMFGLTKAEARTAAVIAEGKGVKSVARQLSIAPSTARSHLHQVFMKTGTGRQAELARLISGISIPAAEPSGFR